ncbi:MAG: aminoacyl-tRNA hydrolase [Candidatus Zhuqueibacterota bacterium]
MDAKFVIVGLGNPGKKYAHTRHNIGFMVLDRIAGKASNTFEKSNRLYWSASYTHGLETVALVKPATFMNLSGQAVADYLTSQNAQVSQLLVICDDINLPFGTIRIRFKGSDGGQKGLRSIIEHLGTDNFPRLRIGISNDFEDAAEYVLSQFSDSEAAHLPIILSHAADAVQCFLENGIESAMSRFNRNYLDEDVV